MAQIEPLIPLIFRWEGGWADDPDDRGGKTNMGVTLATWKSCGYDKDLDGDVDQEDLRLITRLDVVNLLRIHYWNRWMADLIVSQPVANILVDWLWNSGRHGIVIPQRLLGVRPDGVVGMQTIHAVNSRDPRSLFGALKEERKAFFLSLVKRDPKQKKFLKGWMNRLNAFKFTDP